AALAQARAAEQRIALLEGKLERAGDRALRLTAERDAARRAGQRATVPRIVRERVVDDAALARARRAAAAAAAKAESTAVAARKLTAAELAELRVTGPSGPAVMAEALKALTTARKTNNPMRMQDALRRVAQAAVTWQERI